MLAGMQTLLIVVIATFFINSNGQLSSIVLDICEMLPKDSIILQPNSCINWIKCPSTFDGNDYEEGSCFPGLYFDKNFQKCRLQNDVQCPFESNTDKNNSLSNLCLNQIDGSFLASPNSCNEFIYCKNSIPRLSKCPSNLVFDPKKISCVYSEDYDCKQNKKPSSPTTSTTTKINQHKECLLISDNINFANRESCLTYHKCHLGEMKNFTCKEKTSFDYIRGKCYPIKETSCLADKENKNPLGRICGTIKNKIVGYVPDGKTCSGYYHCKNIEGTIDRNPIWNKCSNGRFFDALTVSCRDRTNVKCIHDRCEGMGNKYVNVIGNCKAYAHCKNNVKISDGKCSANYYFDEKSQGCTQQKISYAACS